MSGLKCVRVCLSESFKWKEIMSYSASLKLWRLFTSPKRTATQNICTHLDLLIAFSAKERISSDQGHSQTLYRWANENCDMMTHNDK